MFDRFLIEMTELKQLMILWTLADDNVLALRRIVQVSEADYFTIKFLPNSSSGVYNFQNFIVIR